MGIEREVKFEASTRDLRKLATARILRRSDGELPRHKYSVSTYFDTPKLLLRKNGVSLRVRQTGKKRVQTIKAVNGGISPGRTISSPGSRGRRSARPRGAGNTSGCRWSPGTPYWRIWA